MMGRTLQPGDAIEEMATGDLLSAGLVRIRRRLVGGGVSSLCVAFQKFPWEENSGYSRISGKRTMVIPEFL